MVNEEPKTQTSHTGSSDDDPISQLLSGLKRVDAPGDFEFRVKAGIAERRSSSSGYNWLPGTLKVAVPMALLLLLGGYVGIGSFYYPANEQAAVTQVQPVEAAPQVDTMPVIVQQAEPGSAINANHIVTLNSTPKPVEAVNRTITAVPEKRVPSRTADNGSGSYDEAFRESQLIPLVNTNPNSSSPNSGKLSVKDVFGMLGISASFSTAGWIVGSVSGAAQRSGLRPGDVIEAVNGQTVSRNTAFAGAFTGSSLRIRREGKVMHISLR
jgi:hypothetical protein